MDMSKIMTYGLVGVNSAAGALMLGFSVFIFGCDALVPNKEAEMQSAIEANVALHPEKFQSIEEGEVELQSDIDTYLAANDLDINLTARFRLGSRDLSTGLWSDYFDFYLDGQRKMTKEVTYHPHLVGQPDAADDVQVSKITIYGRDEAALMVYQVHQDMFAFGVVVPMEIADLGTVDVALFTDVGDLNVAEFIEVGIYRHTTGIVTATDGDVLGYTRCKLTADTWGVDFSKNVEFGMTSEWVAEIPPGYEAE